VVAAVTGGVCATGVVVLASQKRHRKGHDD